MRRIARLLALMAAVGPTLAAAQSLNMGDKAPKIAVKEFVKGEPVKDFEKGKTYVVEFWATWCGPCITSIPHLTEMQKEHKDVSFIGVSVWENDASLVKPFVKKMGDKMDYRVAMDLVPEPPKADDKEKGDDDGKKKPKSRKPREAGEMAKTWMEAAEQSGIPTAFVINGEGKVAWIGHPMNMAKPLKRILAGDWNILAEAAKLKKMKSFMADLNKAMRKQDSKTALKLIDDAVAEDPEMEEKFAMAKFMMMIKSEDSADQIRALAFGQRLLDKVYTTADSVTALNAIAWEIVDPDAKIKYDKSAKEFALKAAEKGDMLANHKDPAIADTYAKALFDCGQVAKAATVQERAVKLSVGTPFEKDDSLKERLKQYRKAAERKLAN